MVVQGEGEIWRGVSRVIPHLTDHPLLQSANGNQTILSQVLDEARRFDTSITFPDRPSLTPNWVMTLLWAVPLPLPALIDSVRAKSFLKLHTAALTVAEGSALQLLFVAAGKVPRLASLAFFFKSVHSTSSLRFALFVRCSAVA